MSDIYEHAQTTALIRAALTEDLQDIGDITCAALVPAGARLAGVVRAKAAGVVCGLPLFAQVFAALGGGVVIGHCAADGSAVAVGDVVLRFHGDAAVLLQGERTALNLCQRLSGTASMARRYVAAVAGTRAEVFDTRKTTPGLRRLEKHAVLAGGARNHRIGLYDQVLIKENHIALMAPATPGAAAANADFSAPAEAVRRCRMRLGDQAVVEVEIEDLRDLAPVIAAGADIVLLDNLGPDLLRQAVTARDALVRPGARPVQLEASGGITLATIRAVAESGVERISTGALTHSVHALDLSMRCTPVAG